MDVTCTSLFGVPDRGIDSVYVIEPRVAKVESDSLDAARIADAETVTSDGQVEASPTLDGRKAVLRAQCGRDCSDQQQQY